MTKRLEALQYGKEVKDDDLFTVGVQTFLFNNFKDCLDLTLEEIEKNGRPVEVATSAPNVLEEYFRDHEILKLDGGKRLVIRT